jgi:hypothetical protein
MLVIAVLDDAPRISMPCFQGPSFRTAVEYTKPFPPLFTHAHSICCEDVMAPRVRVYMVATADQAIYSPIRRRNVRRPMLCFAVLGVGMLPQPTFSQRPSVSLAHNQQPQPQQRLRRKQATAVEIGRRQITCASPRDRGARKKKEAIFWSSIFFA